MTVESPDPNETSNQATDRFLSKFFREYPQIAVPSVFLLLLAACRASEYIEPVVSAALQALGKTAS